MIKWIPTVRIITTNYCTYFGLWGMGLLETLGVLIHRVIQTNCSNTGLYLRVSGSILNGSSGFSDNFSLSTICIADLGLRFTFHSAIGVDRRIKIKLKLTRNGLEHLQHLQVAHHHLKLIIYAEVRSLVNTNRHCMAYLRASVKHEASLKTIFLM